MLWRKHWLEVRWLSLFAAVGFLAMAWFSLSDYQSTRSMFTPTPLGGPRAGTYELVHMPFTQAIRGYLEAGLPMAFVAISILLGVGGLGHERASGTATFTLSLPFTRRRLMVGRFAVGAAVLAALAFACMVGAAGWAANRGVGPEFTLLMALGLACCLTAASLAIYSFTFFAANVSANTIRTVATVATLLVILPAEPGKPESEAV